VCVVIERYFPFVAGAEKQVQARIPPLAQRGVNTVVVTRLERGATARSIVNGAPVQRIAVSGNRVLKSLLFTLGALLFLIRHRNRIDVVHACSLYSPATVALLAKLLLGIPAVVEVHNGGPLGEFATLRSVRFGVYRMRVLARLVDTFVALSDEIERGLRGIGVPNDRIARIANGVDVSRFQPPSASHRSALRAELHLSNRRVALFVGRLEPMKGVDSLLDAWSTVRHAVPDPLLLVVGDGALRAALQARSVPDVRFAGLVDDPLPYMHAADCLVLPSLSEGMPVVLLEAMATGLPCVATAIGGTVDVLRPDVDGWLIGPNDTAALAAVLVQVLTSGELSRIGAAARVRVVRDFSLEDAADRLAALYRHQSHGRVAR
jgi:glycosyltransferase involved in cell wall biosynthesis